MVAVGRAPWSAGPWPASCVRLIRQSQRWCRLRTRGSAPPSSARLALVSSILGQARANLFAQSFPIHPLTAQLGLRRFHHDAHLLGGGRLGFSQRGGDGGVVLFGRGRRRHVRFDQRALGLFLLGQLAASALSEHLGGFGALLDERVQRLYLARLIERLHRIDFHFLQGGLDHADSAQTRFILRLHRRNQVLLDPFK